MASQDKPRIHVFVVSSGGTIMDWTVSSATNAAEPSKMFFVAPTIKAHPTVVSTKEFGDDDIFMRALNRRLAGYSVIEEDHEPTGVWPETIRSDVSSGS
jgi:hypothetical protein